VSTVGLLLSWQMQPPGLCDECIEQRHPGQLSLLSLQGAWPGVSILALQVIWGKLPIIATRTDRQGRERLVKLSDWKLVLELGAGGGHFEHSQWQLNANVWSIDFVANFLLPINFGLSENFLWENFAPKINLGMGIPSFGELRDKNETSRTSISSVVSLLLSTEELQLPVPCT